MKVLTYLLLMGFLLGCGVKGRPLPPVPDTPQESEKNQNDS